MKTVILTLLVVLVVSHSEALRCYCGGLRHCSGSVETCSGSNQVCAGVIIQAGSTVNYFKGCYKSGDCERLNNPPTTTSRCCRTDLCNR
uniref:UPAR/Ly6 domain-containing protein n=1 Tax=Seriola dumerili TaxID=41447 RepID=A0A3B4VID6_SERDU